MKPKSDGLIRGATLLRNPMCQNGYIKTSVSALTEIVDYLMNVSYFPCGFLRKLAPELDPPMRRVLLQRHIEL